LPYQVVEIVSVEPESETFTPPNVVLVAAGNVYAFAVIADCTIAVVAICVVLVLEAAVGAAGVPVNVGEAIGAFRPIDVLIVVAKFG
jgi:hypothetical protein